MCAFGLYRNLHLFRLTHSPPPTFEVEYRIQNFDDKITSVRYIDADGTSITLGNPLANFPGGTKTIKVTKPFTAELEFFVANGSFSTRHYTLFIYVDGVIETNKQVSVPGLSTKKSIISVELN